MVLPKWGNRSTYVLREVAAQFERPVILFSGGKDSIVITYLAYKAFYPAKISFPLLHIDTGHNFEETIQYRDELAKKLGAELIVGSVQESIDKGRFFSHRDEFGQWNPKNQRPELWNIFNGRKNMGEHFRVFPISNWTEMDVWQYIFLENIPMPSLYFTHEREVFNRDGQWLAALPCIKRKPTEEVVKKLVRCRTIGDITCTGLTESKATTVADIIDEIASTRVTERGGRADDKRSEAQVYHRRYSGTYSVYPQHGDGCKHCRPEHHPHRYTPRRVGADRAPQLHFFTARHTTYPGGYQQDGPG